MRAVVLVAAVCLVASGCAADRRAAAGTQPATTQDDVTVTGTAWSLPVLDYTPPLTVTKPRIETLWQGLGETVHDGDLVLLETYAEDGRTRKVVANTYAGSPRAVRVSRKNLGSALYSVIVGRPTGSRYLEVAESDGVPVVTTIDVLPARATGTEVAQQKGVPQVSLAPDGAPSVTFPKGVTASDDLTVLPLVRGSGPQLHAGQLVTVQFTGVTWPSSTAKGETKGAVFDTTWGDDTLPATVRLGVGDVVEGWDEGLLQVPVGSRVLLVVPPSLGYQDTSSKLADQTLVYVVDILDAHDPGTGPVPGATATSAPAPSGSSAGSSADKS